MEPKVNYVVVGAFVVLLGALLVGVVLWLGKGFDQKTYDRYYAYMEESVTGLSVDASVKYRGVGVGRVKEIVLNPDNPQQVRLTLEIERGTPIKEDTIAILDVQGLTGLAIVDLTGGSRESPPLEAKSGESYPVIQTGPSLLVRFDQAATQLFTNLNRVTKNVDALLDETNREALSQLLKDLATLTQTLTANKQRFDEGITNAAQTMENVLKASKMLNEEMPFLIDRMHGSADSLEAMAEKVGQASTAVGSAVERTKPDVERFSQQTLSEMSALVAELRQLTSTLQRTAQQLEHQPNSLIFGRTPPPRGPGE
ncbi:MlaD family protein [Candidatus Nitronereus thalassa]|uniref:MlaD family protein n=1 Tax=Candidatus Nitronereus thalassa TaxID=3020898 RepID=A0ABU3K8N3_9BACT|nr:MlaD family protein [Candidatus Nitronereus thalassa]MDT7042761.1 MlaD family protein [Candidatus Nitronereus thalassa]